MWNIINSHCGCSYNASPRYRGAAHESNVIINMSYRVLEVFGSRNRLTLEASTPRLDYETLFKYSPFPLWL